MTREEIWKNVSEALRPDFGRLLDVRDVRRVRGVANDAWLVTVVLTASSGDIHVADLTVDDAGAMTPTLGADHVIEAIRRAGHPDATAETAAPAVPDELADLVADVGGEEASQDPLGEPEESVRARVAEALSTGDPESLRAARVALPRLLGDHERRGTTLYTMAQVEIALEEPAIAQGYLEAAAREFADRFDLPALERAAGLALVLLGREGFRGSPVHALLEQSRTRLQPLGDLFEARSFQGLREGLRNKLSEGAVLQTLGPGEALVTEGEPSRNVFVVKSGLVGVWLEKPGGGSWLVRCCFPGWLLGESSVLGGPDARCTASLRAERVSEVWVLPAGVMRDVMQEDPVFGQRIAETKQIHRIDSFFSMHETMGQLDVQVRDEMLSCIQRLETFDKATVLMPANAVPAAACLVAKGAIELYAEGKPDAPAMSIGPDSFYGVRDAIHQIAPALTAVASPGTTVAFFDAARLQALCERSPEQVVAVLERLG